MGYFDITFYIFELFFLKTLRTDDTWACTVPWEQSAGAEESLLSLDEHIVSILLTVLHLACFIHVRYCLVPVVEFIFSTIFTTLTKTILFYFFSQKPFQNK